MKTTVRATAWPLGRLATLQKENETLNNNITAAKIEANDANQAKNRIKKENESLKSRVKEITK